MEIMQLLIAGVMGLCSNSTVNTRGAGVDSEEASRGDLPFLSEMAANVVSPECLGPHQEVSEAWFF